MTDVIWERTDYPPEPAGPVWDQNGDKWERRERGVWRGPHDLQWAWNSLCANSRRLTTVPPRKPEVGGIVETEEQYAALPEGSIVCIDNSSAVHIKATGGIWYIAGSTSEYDSRAVSGSTPRTILRVGWES